LGDVDEAVLRNNVKHQSKRGKTRTHSCATNLNTRAKPYNVGESGINSNKETTELKDGIEVAKKGVKCVDEALISSINTL
jgi:hypothetical protein